tara:strand:- start:3433 stop:4482 length:1050 start_codon:yes stop_codon:yes gene_type:complete
MKLILENWRKYLNESDLWKNRYPFDPEQDGAWFELSLTLWRNLNKVEIPEGLRLGFLSDSLLSFVGPGDNPFEDKGKKTSWDIDSKALPDGFYVYVPSAAEIKLKPQTKSLHRFFETKSHHYRGDNASGWWKDIDDLEYITPIISGSLNATIKKIYDAAAAKLLSKFDSSSLENDEGLFYHIVPKKSDVQSGQILKPYFTGAKKRGFMGDETEQLDKFEVILEKYRPKQLPSRLNAAFLFASATGALKYNQTWKGDIWLAEPLGDVAKVDMRLAEDLQKEIFDRIDRYPDYYWEDDEEEVKEQQRYDDEFAVKSRQLAKQYWAGEQGERPPAFEMIVGPPGIKLVKKVR